MKRKNEHALSDYDSSSDSDSEPESDVDMDVMEEQANVGDRGYESDGDEVPADRIGNLPIPEVLKQFSRPPVSKRVRTTKPDISFQNVDIQYGMRSVHGSFRPPNDKQKREARLDVYGVTKAGNSICVHVHGFNPFFYTNVKGELEEKIRDKEYWRRKGEMRLEEIKSQLEHIVCPDPESLEVLKVEVVWRKSIYGYSKQKQPFLKVTLTTPAKVSQLRDSIEPANKFQEGFFTWCDKTYESNIPFTSRFMVDEGMAGAGWSTLTKGKYHMRKESGHESHCQIEADVHYTDLEHHNPDERNEMAELRGLFFDIEVAPAMPGNFPQAHRPGDKVISISIVMINMANYQCMGKFVLALGESSRMKDSDGAMVLTCPTEKDLLLYFAALIRVFDPDSIMGYNSINFDMQFLMDRAIRLSVKDQSHLNFLFEDLSRQKNYRCKVKHEKFESGALGKMDYFLARMPGRLQYDVMLLVRRDVTAQFSGYSLGIVAKNILKGQTKDEMTYEAIPAMYHGLWPKDMPRAVTTREWNTLMEYFQPVCQKDAKDKAPEEGKRVWKRVKPVPQEVLDQAEFDNRAKELLQREEWREEEVPKEIMKDTWSLVLRYNRPIQRNHQLWWSWTAEGRAVIHKYCLQDAIVTEAVQKAKMYFGNHVELGRLCYIPMMSLITQGQQIRIISALLRYVHGTEFIIPFYRPPEYTAQEKRRRKKGFKGAAVLDPFVRWIVGSEDGMIPVLDFAGLYPSIMMDWNLCYSTWVRPEDVERLQAEGVKMHQTPVGHWFVDREEYDGILPRILRRLTAARSAAKKGCGAAQQLVKEYKLHKRYHQLSQAMDDETLDQKMEALQADFREAFEGRLGRDWKGSKEEKEDALDEIWMKEVTEFQEQWGSYEMVMEEIERLLKTEGIKAGAFDSKQLAIKVVANSVYGFTGAEVGKLPIKEVSSSVTAYGREMIMTVKRLCEHYNPETGMYGCDPESENEEFRNGVCKHPMRVVYGDTDSVFPWMIGGTDLQYAWDVGEKIGKMATDVFQRMTKDGSYIKLELEKVVDLLNLMGKKRYCTRQWEKNRAGEWVCRVNTKGFELVRRDTCMATRRPLRKAVDLMMPVSKETRNNPPNVKQAIQEVHDMLRALNKNELPLNDFVITKSVNRDDSDYANGPPPHMVLRRKIMKRDPGRKIDKGQRIPHAYVHDPQGSEKLVDKCEDPEWILRHGLQVDTRFYVDRQMRKPLRRFFANILYRKGCQAASVEEIDALMAQAAHREERERHAEKVLFTGDHMRHVVQRMPVNSIFKDMVIWRRWRTMLEQMEMSMEDWFVLAELESKEEQDEWEEWAEGKIKNYRFEQMAKLFVQGQDPTQVTGLRATWAEKLKEWEFSMDDWFILAKLENKEQQDAWTKWSQGKLDSNEFDDMAYRFVNGKDPVEEEEEEEEEEVPRPKKRPAPAPKEKDTKKQKTVVFGQQSLKNYFMKKK